MKNKKKKKKPFFSVNLAFTIWLCFIVFILVVFVLIWVFQILFLSKFYDKMKISDIKKATTKMVEMYDTFDYEDYFKRIALDNDMCVLMLSPYGQQIYTDEVVFGKSCILHALNRPFSQSELISKINETKDGYFYEKILNSRTNTELLLYGTKVGNEGYLFINTPLAPVASTTAILQRQLFIITDILIVLGCIISLVAANAISKPIIRITRNAEKLAKGKYDITLDRTSYYEAKQLGDVLQFAAAEIAKIDTQQRDLIANVSHDLRTPLTMLKAYAEMIRDLSGDNPPKRNAHLQIIIDETDRLAALVSDMLDLSKLESGALGLNYSEFSITPVLQNIVDFYNGLNNGYAINFIPDEDINVYCDEGKIKQVIYNLINNAINYTGEDKNVYIKQINSAAGVTIEVTDSGRGIKQEEVDLIFDKYYRSEHHKRTTFGTGLGLSIVKVILKKHNFAFGVRSIENVGSTFWFRIQNNRVTNG